MSKRGEKDGLIPTYERPDVIWNDKYSSLILFFICWLTFGSYWVYDTPGAIGSQLGQWFEGVYNYTPASNLNLYSVYSYPNVILAFFGGFIVDKVTGVRVGAMIFCGLILTGQTIFSLAIQFKLYWLALVGRFIYGLGGESLTVAQNTFTARWFEGKRLATAFGLVVAFSRIGTSVNFLVTPYFTQLGVPFSIWFGTEMCMLSFLAVGFVGLLDWYGEAAVQRLKERQGGGGGEEEVSFKQILDFPIQSWIIFFNCLFFYISVLTFYTVASTILHEVAGYPKIEASNFIAIPNFVAIFASPFFGYVLDKTGRTLIFLAVAGVMQVLGHLAVLAIALNWFTIHPIAIMIWIGIGYSMYAAGIWPILPFVIKEEMLGTAYGTMTSVQNLGLAVFPQIVGVLMKDLTGSARYIAPIFIFIACAGASVGLTVLLFIIDRARTGGVLNGTGELKQEYKKKLNNPELVDWAQ